MFNRVWYNINSRNDDILIVIVQHGQFYFYILAQQQSTGRPVAPFGYIILTTGQPVFALSLYWCVLNGKATNINIRFDSTGARTHDLPHSTTDVILFDRFYKPTHIFSIYIYNVDRNTSKLYYKWINWFIKVGANHCVMPNYQQIQFFFFLFIKLKIRKTNSTHCKASTTGKNNMERIHKREVTQLGTITWVMYEMNYLTFPEPWLQQLKQNYSTVVVIQE